MKLPTKVHAVEYVGPEWSNIISMKYSEEEANQVCKHKEADRLAAIERNRALPKERRSPDAVYDSLSHYRVRSFEID